jgi:hypothetical protein
VNLCQESKSQVEERQLTSIMIIDTKEQRSKPRAGPGYSTCDKLARGRLAFFLDFFF